MTAMTAFLRKTGHGSGKEEKRPQWRLYNERSRRGWYSDTPLKTDARGDALEFPPTTFDNISAIKIAKHYNRIMGIKGSVTDVTTILDPAFEQLFEAVEPYFDNHLIEIWDIWASNDEAVGKIEP